MNSIPIYCFNLKKFKDRKDHILNLAYKHNIKINIIEAFDGKLLPKSNKFSCCKSHNNRKIDYIHSDCEFNHVFLDHNNNKHFFLINSNITVGEYGLAMTTYNTYLDFIENNDSEWLIILEDDIDLCEDFNNELKNIENDLDILEKNNIDFVYLNDSIDLINCKDNINNKYYPVKKGCGFYGYMISKKGMKKLLNIFNPLIFPIDLQSISHFSSYIKYSQFQYREKNFLKQNCYINGLKYYKNLVYHNNIFKSNIHDYCAYHPKFGP